MGNVIILNIIIYLNVVYFDFDGIFYYSEIEMGGQKNVFCMSDYYCLDFSVEFCKKKLKWECKWVVGVYNVYYYCNFYYVIVDMEYICDDQGNFVDEK